MQVNIARVDEMKLGQAVKRDEDKDTGKVTVYTETTVTLKVENISAEDYEALKALMGCLRRSAAVGSQQGIMELFPARGVADSATA